MLAIFMYVLQVHKFLSSSFQSSAVLLHTIPHFTLQMTVLSCKKLWQTNWLSGCAPRTFSRHTINSHKSPFHFQFSTFLHKGVMLLPPLLNIINFNRYEITQRQQCVVHFPAERLDGGDPKGIPLLFLWRDRNPFSQHRKTRGLMVW